MENLMEREEEPAEDIMDASLIHTSKRTQWIATTRSNNTAKVQKHT